MALLHSTLYRVCLHGVLLHIMFLCDVLQGLFSLLFLHSTICMTSSLAVITQSFFAMFFFAQYAVLHGALHGMFFAASSCVLFCNSIFPTGFCTLFCMDLSCTAFSDMEICIAHCILHGPSCIAFSCSLLHSLFYMGLFFAWCFTLGLFAQHFFCIATLHGILHSISAWLFM